MKATSNSLILGIFLFLCSASYAQITIDNQERIIFGNKVYNNALSITDEQVGATNSGTPFRIVRSGSGNTSGNVYFTRNATSFSHGFLMFPDGCIAIGSLPSTNNPYPYAALHVNNNGFVEHTLMLNGFSSYGNAIQIVQPSSMVYGYNYVIYYNGGWPNHFSVSDEGVVLARGLHSLSDVSLKREIETLSNPLAKVMQLRGVSYYMGDTQKKEDLPFDEVLTNLQKRNPEMTAETLKQMQSERKRKEIGVIAQEVEKVLPEAVSTLENGMKAVSYSDLTVLLIEAVKEQQTIIEDLKSRISALEGRRLSAETAELASETDQLEKNLNK